jgi:NAD-dependent dihydropyrimidine dehydrogenase PreA subunit
VYKLVSFVRSVVSYCETLAAWTARQHKILLRDAGKGADLRAQRPRRVAILGTHLRSVVGGPGKDVVETPQPCVDVLDKACIEECPVDCIYEGDRMLYIHPDECVDCGACEPVCPVEAIFYEDDVPDQWKDYYKVNVDFFEDLGSPGGASKVGKIDKDHPIVAALPPQGDEH